jgi:hypothetical protein
VEPLEALFRAEPEASNCRRKRFPIPAVRTFLISRKRIKTFWLRFLGRLKPFSRLRQRLKLLRRQARVRQRQERRLGLAQVLAREEPQLVAGLRPAAGTPQPAPVLQLLPEQVLRAEPQEAPRAERLPAVTRQTKELQELPEEPPEAVVAAGEERLLVAEPARRAVTRRERQQAAQSLLEPEAEAAEEPAEPLHLQHLSLCQTHILS